MLLKLSNKDLRILYELDFNARVSLIQLAKKTRLSRDVVVYRIRQLEKEGIIEGYYIIPNTVKLGLLSLKVMLKFQNTNKSKEEEIIHFLKNSEEVGWLVSTDGYYDLMFMSWLKDTIEFDIYFKKFLSQFSEYFYLRDFIIVTENHACNKEYLLYKKKSGIKDAIISGLPKSEIDEIDKDIINILSSDAKIPYWKVAQQLNMTPEGVSARIKKLIKNKIILTFRPKLNHKLLDIHYYNVLIKLKDTSHINKMFSFFRIHKNITYFTKYLGEYDIGIDIEVSSVQQFRDIMDEIKNLFSEYILNYNYVLIFKEHKITY